MRGCASRQSPKLNTMYFIIENNGKPLRWEDDNTAVCYGTIEDALIDFRPQDGDSIVPVAKSRKEALKWIGKHHGIEYETDEVVYCLNGWTAEWDEDENVWYLYENEEDCIAREIIRMEG